MKRRFRQLILLLPFLISADEVFACITCNRQVQEAIFDSAFYPNLLLMLSPFILLAIIVAVLAGVFSKRQAAFLNSEANRGLLNPVPLTTAALVTGIGLGGFIDGIVFHQILQWHEMLSNKIPPTTLIAKTVNMFWDGIFHAFCLLVTLVGMVMLWKAGQRKDASHSGYLLVGGLLAGWGIFNVIEGIMDHHLLKLHNVREITDNVAAWNFGFLGFAIVLLGAGWALMRKGDED